MKTKYLTEEKIKNTIAFMKERKEHARVTENKAWVKEYDDAITVIKELSTIDV
ncbi:MAG: hypothetical protein JEY99_15100 [Spirochaetales bacterium]|nr:hypothetical protein [Spirochaetales bacterium]